MDKREVESKFGSFIGELESSELEVREYKEQLNRIFHDIHSIKDQIFGLFEEKRAADREEKSYYQGLIEDLLEEKRSLYESKAQTVECLQASKQRLRDARKVGKRLSNSLNCEMQVQQQNVQKLNSLAANPFADRLQVAKSAIESSFEFSKGILNSIASRLSRSETTIDIHFEPVRNYFEEEGEAGLRFAEPSQSDVYLTADREKAIPMDGHTVFDTLDSVGEAIFDMIERGVFAAADGAQRVGSVAVEYSCALLKTAGHTAILRAGGPGQPDILSLDREGRLWITESKGTAKNNDLVQSGLERPVRTGCASAPEKLMENSPQWLLRKIDSTLLAIKAAIEAAPSVEEQSQYKRMHDAYLGAARRNFRRSEYNSQVVQVGFSTEYMALKPPYAQNSRVFDRWVQESQPDKIVQIDVVPASLSANSSDAGGTEDNTIS